MKSSGHGWPLDVDAVDDVGVLGLGDADVVDGALLLALTPVEDTRVSAEVEELPLDELVHAAHSSINPAAATPANARRGCAIITAPHWA